MASFCNCFTGGDQSKQGPKHSQHRPSQQPPVTPVTPTAQSATQAQPPPATLSLPANQPSATAGPASNVTNPQQNAAPVQGVARPQSTSGLTSRSSIKPAPKPRWTIFRKPRASQWFEITVAPSYFNDWDVRDCLKEIFKNDQPSTAHFEINEGPRCFIIRTDRELTPDEKQVLSALSGGQRA